jgi:dihydrodipicolinate synthase/N-acetylneuraminate lyase
MTTLSGIWLPIVTPFHDGAVDFVSYEKLRALHRRGGQRHLSARHDRRKPDPRRR